MTDSGAKIIWSVSPL